MYVLSHCDKYSQYISWNYNIDPKNRQTTGLGQAFTVHDIDMFASEVMPAFFKEAKYESFQRQLYRWGFVKTKTGKGNRDKRSFTYRHSDEMFIEKDWEKCSILSYSKTTKYANPFSKNCLPFETERKTNQEPEGYVFQRRASLVSDSGNGRISFDEDAAIMHTYTPPPAALQTRRKSNSNLLNLEEINFGEVNFERSTSNLLPLSAINSRSALYNSWMKHQLPPTTTNSHIGVLGSTMPMTPQNLMSSHQLPDFSQTLYTQSILHNAMNVLHNDSSIDRKESK